MGLRRSGDIRGVRDIRTYSGRVDTGSVPYLAYMKISCLEMEKARRERERNSAMARVRNIDSRIHDIDSEKEHILVELGEHEDVKGSSSGSKNNRNRQRRSSVTNGSSFQPVNAGTRDNEGFKIKY